LGTRIRSAGEVRVPFCAISFLICKGSTRQARAPGLYFQERSALRWSALARNSRIRRGAFLHAEEDAQPYLGARSRFAGRRHDGRWGDPTPNNKKKKGGSVANAAARSFRAGHREGPLVTAGESREPAASELHRRTFSLCGVLLMRARKPFLRRGRSKLGGSSEGFVSEFPYGVVGLADQLAGNSRDPGSPSYGQPALPQRLPTSKQAFLASY
jgi:hypothetical protein